jgi:hypothetical protein
MTKLANLDARWVYLSVFLAVFLPLFRPLGLPITVGDVTRATYAFVESLPSEARVIVSPSFSPSSDAEVLPQMMAVVRHLMSKKARLVWVSLTVEASTYAGRAMDSLSGEYSYQYGQDYVILPFMPGQQTAIAAMANDFRQAVSADLRGISVWGFEIMKGIHSISDFDLLVDFNTGDTSIYYLQQVQPMGVPVIAGASGVTVPYLMPYLGTGQLSGLLGGLRGAAEYEMASNNPGQALSSMDAQSLSHAIIVAFILMGNVSSIVARLRSDFR